MGTIQQRAEAERRQAAAAYFDAVRRGRAPEDLLRLGEAAGRTPAQVEADVDAMAEVASLILEAAEIGKARRALKGAEARRGRAEAAFERASKRLLGPIEEATAAADAARGRVLEAEAAARKVLRVHRERPELLPADALPAAVRGMIAAAGRAESRRAVENRRAAALREVDRLREVVDVATAARHRAEHTISADSDAAVRRCKARLAEAEALLREAVGRLHEAEDAGRAEVPE